MLCDEDQLLWEHYETVKKYFDYLLNSIYDYSDLQKEFATLLKHIEGHANENVFIRCKDCTCCFGWGSNETKLFLQKFNKRLFSPTLSKETGRYNKFLQNFQSDKHEYRDSVQPTVVQKNLGKCSICPR